MAGRDTDDVLDMTMLECLAFIAAANGRSVEEELNLAVKTYVLQEFADHGEDRFIGLAVPDQSVAK